MLKTGHIVAQKSFAGMQGAAFAKRYRSNTEPRSFTSEAPVDQPHFDTASSLAAFGKQSKQEAVGLTTGSRVVTDRGRVSIGSLVAGDKVWTLDNGLQPLRWIMQRKLKLNEKNRHLRPVKIEAGAFGPGAPLTDLSVAPGQRILINDWRAKQFFEQSEILVTASDLVGQPGITRDDSCRAETYAYLHFDGFELVETSGLISESFVHERRFDLYKSGPMRNAASILPSRPLIEGKAAHVLHGIDTRKTEPSLNEPAMARSFATAPAYNY